MMQSPITVPQDHCKFAPVTAGKACLHLEPKQYVDLARLGTSHPDAVQGLYHDMVTAHMLTFGAWRCNEAQGHVGSGTCE